MFIVPPNNFNGTPMWNAYPMFEPPMMPIQDFDNLDDTRQKPMFETSTNNQDFDIAPGSPIVNNPLYNQGWLTTQIGKYIKIEFLIGTSMLIDREGILKEVGISFIVIQEAGTNDMLMCDIYSIKFVRAFDPQPVKCIP
ncbi:hypothetical protein K9O30_00075 [Clostridium bowmanii]|uniref:hypothetical protein n=1 Tax=Clostridium bowmanii TaxID=132925 RepID=UPI001CD417DF|nr:hypothetical protein [Clostridium bowmanii]MCA1072168.1 hypothetical protein [Clostridium bowmanii]